MPVTFENVRLMALSMDSVGQHRVSYQGKPRDATRLRIETLSPD